MQKRYPNPHTHHPDYEKMVSMRSEGKLLREIGDEIGISKQRVCQIIGKNTPRISRAKERYHKRLILQERFWGRVIIKEKEECWVWTGAKTPLGYGHLRANYKSIYAHRLAWILTNGNIPDGLCICHKCDNPPCCNPDHLFLGTQLDNIHDRDKKGRGRGAQRE